MAPAVHATGPRGAFTISGSQSYENLYTLNGVVITENLRGSPFNLYIEDAIQETTVSTAGVSAEYGRFGGGVANAITKSGGNFFSGSLRTSFANDSWRSFTPFESTQLIANPALKLKTDKTVPTYELTLGGPIQKERLWFFAAMRAQNQESTRTTVATNVPYVRANDDKRYEGKLTYTAKPGHTLQLAFTKINNVLRNNSSFNVMDLASLTDQGQPQDLTAAHYTGILSPNFFVEGQLSFRHLSLTNVGAGTRDLINGTMIFDQQKGTRFWSPTFCAGSVCDGDEQRNNSDLVVKATYFQSGKGPGSHSLVFGYDRFNDNILANTHGTGSDYRIRATSTVVRGTDIFPQFIPNSTMIEYDPLLQKSVGSNLVTHSAFVNDSWRLNNHFSFGLGLRLDKNAASDGGGNVVGNKLSWSPRLSAIWDPRADGKWAVSGSYARYVMALTSNLAASATPAGNLSSFLWLYGGPAVNADPNGSLLPADQALTQIFDWFNTNNISGTAPIAANVPGVNMKILKPLTSPYSNEYAGGVSRTLGRRGMVRVDATFRRYHDFYSLRTDTTTGAVSDGFKMLDLGVLENTDRVKRRYTSLVTQATYNLAGVDFGGNYTLSHAYGNLDGETAGGGPSGALLTYPEYVQASWNYPDGDLAIDQRHRARVWATYAPELPRVPGTLTFGLVEQMASGTPYGAVQAVDTRPFVTNPGYQTAPAAVTYYFTARDAFHTEATHRADLSVNYAYRFPHRAGPEPELFFRGEVLNLFNQFQLCGCGASVFNNGGTTDMTTIGQSVVVNRSVPFNPFTTAPVEGVNWSKHANFGTALNALAYTSPRLFRFSVGLRF